MFIHTYETKNYNIQEPEIEKWYVAAFTTPKNYYEIAEWCHQIFGPSGLNSLTHQTRWQDEIFYGEVYFRDEKDLEWFVLRWS